MKGFLELMEAKLEAIEPWWRRVAVLAAFLVLCSNIGDWIWDESNDLESEFWTGGMFGPVTYVMFGPLQLFSVIAAGFVGYRFLHAQKGDLVGFCFLGALVAFNTGFYHKESRFTTAKLVAAHLVALLILAILLRIRYGSREEP